MEVEENALLPNMMEESALLTENHLRKVGGAGEERVGGGGRG